NYRQIKLTDQPATKHTIIGNPETFAFDLSENKIDAAVSSDTASSALASSTGVSTAAAAVPVPASSPLQYFLKIDGVNGDSTVKGFEGWFSIDGFDIGVQNTASPTGAGGGAGKAVFSLHSLTGLALLVSDVAKGEHIKSVELVGAQTIKDQSIKVYDVTLADALVSSFENDPGPSGVETSLAFNYAKISLTNQPVTGHGILGTPQTFSF